MLYQGLTRRLILTLLPRQIRARIPTPSLTAMLRPAPVLMPPRLRRAAALQPVRQLPGQRLTPPQAARPSLRLPAGQIRQRELPAL